jgi:autotransporter-associated beta strand protein
MLAIVLAALCTPRGAEAQSKYVWKDVNGNWNTPGNWTHTEGPLNDGYPNRPGDEAIFTAPYTAQHVVQIPNGIVVTVGAIYFSSHQINIIGAGTGRLRMHHTAFTGAKIARIEPPPMGFDGINAPVELRSDLTVAIAPPDARIDFTGTISNNLCACGVTKLGPGRMDMRAVNTYLGRTTVERGLLLLEGAASPSVRGGSLAIGPPSPADSTVVAEVRVNSPNQIADDTQVEVKLGGQLTVNDQETIGATTVTRGFITVRSTPATPAGLAFASLAMTGGTIDSRGGAQLHLLGDLTATSAGTVNAVIERLDGNGMLNLGASSRTFDVTRGTADRDLRMLLPITGAGGAGVIKKGNGLLLYEAGNVYPGETWVKEGELRALGPNNVDAFNGPVRVGLEANPAVLTLKSAQSMLDTAPLVIGANGTVDVASTDLEAIGALTIDKGGRLRIGGGGAANLTAETLLMRGGRIEMPDPSSLRINGAVDLSSVSTAAGVESALIAGGRLALGGARTILVGNGPADPDANISAIIVGSASQGVTKTGEGTLSFTGDNTYGGATTIAAGRLNINGKQTSSPVVVAGGILGGKGTTGPVTPQTGGAVSPGDRVGRLSTASIGYTAGSFHSLFLEGSDDGQYGQLAVTGTVTLGNAKFGAGTRANLSPEARYLIIDNDGNDPIIGKFEGIDEGDNLSIGGVPYTITYRGGDGNDVVIEGLTPTTYYLAEGATGAFFDDDVLIANPNEVQAPVTLTFLREGGASVVVQRVIPARSRVTIHVDELEGLEDASASVKVESTDRLPLVVERTMFWDASYYGGHTANAVARPERQWTFAEGFQGFFDTYILIANANAAPTTVTLTFLRENDTPVVKTVDVAAFQRKTVYAGDYDELRGRAFGIVVDATEPVIAERAMYFATQPNRHWAGGHVNTGIVAPSRTWFHAEGATGSFFSTFILLSNPQDTKANVEVRFLLADGAVITRQKTLEPKQRVTINPAAEGDTRLENAAVSTVVQSDVPIVSERSMYWEGDVPKALGEGHNSSGVANTGLRWGLSEGRVGGERNFVTYILLANPTTTAARVRVSYLRENGAPIVKEYDVPATSRFNIDVKTDVTELENSSFGADIEVLNDVPIAVERSLYWDAIGLFWSGGTNALATPLTPAK